MSINGKQKSTIKRINAAMNRQSKNSTSIPPPAKTPSLNMADSACTSKITKQIQPYEKAAQWNSWRWSVGWNYWREEVPEKLRPNELTAPRRKVNNQLRNNQGTALTCMMKSNVYYQSDNFKTFQTFGCLSRDGNFWSCFSTQLPSLAKLFD